MPSSASSTPLIVNAEWLARNLGKPGIKVFDATSHLPTLGRNANAAICLTPLDPLQPMLVCAAEHCFWTAPDIS